MRWWEHLKKPSHHAYNLHYARASDSVNLSPTGGNMRGVPKASFVRRMRGWTWHHVVAFITTFFAYGSFHACRKAFSNVKDLMVKEFTPTNHTHPIYPLETWEATDYMFENTNDADVFMGILDTLFLFAYAIGLFISGMIGDRVNLRFMLSFGMCGSAIATFFFGTASQWMHIRNKYYYYVIYFVNGLLQSTGWPATVAVMGNWFSKAHGGLVFGIWVSNSSVGNIVGSLMVSLVLSYGYEFGMLVNSMLLFCVGLFVLFCLIPHPHDVGLPSPEEFKNTLLVEESERLLDDGIDEDDDGIIQRSDSQEMPNVTDDDENNEFKKKAKPISFLQAWLIPGVALYAISYACLKLVNYTFFFWLPVYLTQGLHWSDTISDELSNFYDGGGILGGVIAGIFTDLVGVRSPVVVGMMFLSALSLYFYSVFGTTQLLNVILMFIVGFMVGGPAGLISSTISADLGKHEKIAGSADALATVAGIVDGTGSFGAAIGQYLVPVINKQAGWHTVFIFLIIMCIVSASFLFPIVYNEIKYLVQKRRQHRQNTN